MAHPLSSPFDKIVCVGKNYLDHAHELGDAVPEKPVLFLKPPSVLHTVSHWESTTEIKLDFNRGSIHYECELVLRVGSDRSFDAVTTGLDLTLRDLQAELKKKGHPWTAGKVFRNSAIIGPWVPWHRSSALPMFRFYLNDLLKQEGDPTAMRLSPSELYDYIDTQFPLLSGDLLFTGTPAGVGPLAANDASIIELEGMGGFKIRWT